METYLLEIKNKIKRGELVTTKELSDYWDYLILQAYIPNTNERRAKQEV
jgi:hypothetical protein